MNLWKDEKGIGLMSLMMSLSISGLLLAGGMMIIFGGIRMGVYALSDWEMVEYVRLSATRIQTSLRGCQSAEPGNNYITMRVVELGDDDAKKVEFSLNTVSGGIIKRNDQPLTGGSILGCIEIVEFFSKKLDENWIRVVIGAENKVSGHRFRLDTNMLCNGKIVGIGK